MIDSAVQLTQGEPHPTASVSRVRENRMHGSMGGGWKRSEEPGHGHWSGTAVRETGGNMKAPGPTARRSNRASLRPSSAPPSASSAGDPRGGGRVAAALSGRCVLPYIGRSGWNTLRIGGAIPDDELREAIDASYHAVVSGLPERERPTGNG
jgi:hypothetical protein